MPPHAKYEIKIQMNWLGDDKSYGYLENYRGNISKSCIIAKILFQSCSVWIYNLQSWHLDF